MDKKFNDGDSVNLLDILGGDCDRANLKLAEPSLVEDYVDFENRTIWLDQEIGFDITLYTKYIIRWNKEDSNIEIDKRKPIKIFILSVGGYLEACFHFIDIIKLSKTPVYGYNVGMAYSAAFVIYLSCHKRYCTPHSSCLLHQGSASFEGSADNIFKSVDKYKGQVDQMMQYTLERTSLTKQILNKHKTEDWYIGLDDQLKYGISNEIIEDISELY